MNTPAGINIQCVPVGTMIKDPDSDREFPVDEDAGVFCRKRNTLFVSPGAYAAIRAIAEKEQEESMKVKPTVNFDREKYLRLRAAYAKANEEGQEVFEFEGHEYLLRYAKYVLEYLESKFK